MRKKPTAKDLLFLLDDRSAVNLKPGEGVEKAKERLEKRLKEGEEDLALLKRAISIYDALLSLGVASKEALAASLLEHAKKRQAKGEMDSAYEALELASRFGGAREKIAFAKTLISGTFGVSSREEGLSILSELADSGYPEASYLIYLLHQTSPDLVEGKLAKEEYLRARALGYPLAFPPLSEDFDERPYTAILLERFYKGEESLAFALSKRKDLGEETRRKYLLLALKQENAEAEEAYAEMVKEEKKEEGRRYFELAGNHGKPECYLKAASLLEASPHFYQGGEGEKQKEELRLYRLAQEANVPADEDRHRDSLWLWLRKRAQTRPRPLALGLSQGRALRSPILAWRMLLSRARREEEPRSGNRLLEDRRQRRERPRIGCARRDL